MRWLRTRHVVSPVGYGMGYRPASARNLWARRGRPLLSDLLRRLGVGGSIGDNLTGLKPLCGQPFDQGATGSCTAQSSCKAARISLLHKSQMPADVDDFSPRIQYGITRQFEIAATTPGGAPLPALSDSGAESDDCITAATNLGLARLGPLVVGVYNDVDAGNVNIEPVLSDDEQTQVFVGAHDVDITASDLSSQWQAAVNAGIACTWALFVDTQNFMAYDGRAPIQKIDLSDPQGGGHQIVGPVYWYTSSSLGLVWGFLNSWGDWGLQGFGEITHKALMSSIDNSIAWDVQLAAQTSGKAA